jgi:phosphate transport system substrate-binding protein
MKAPAWFILVSLVACLAVGCGEKSPKNGESPTSGSLAFLCAESVAPVLGDEAAEFMRLYTKATISMDSTTTREALVRFASGAAKMVVISRELNSEEKKSFAADKFEYGSFTLAKYGIAVVVHPDNPVKQLTLDQIHDIYSGKITRWQDIGGPRGEILPLSLSKNSGVTESFFQKAGIDTGFSPALRVVPTSREMAATVAKDPLAIGFVSMNWTTNRVKALALAKTASDDFVALHQASVYNGSYPLVQGIHAYTTSGAYGLPSGFIAFMVSAPGQKIFLNSGLVPATMPVKLIRMD